MAKIKRNIPVKLSGEQIVNKKLKEMNELLKGIDLSKLPKRPNANQE
ncbi:hypothetical protein SAMN04487995_2225 [Dyadobacter koreensis]|uniref:Uncharacterized protein n=1 Tax=Dyadobacter koreensis TaxID=408657 RepID=A0A1H6TG11_9BACT|nr:hypothetical protein [Dyadobacter koreensis]SEI78941.1 hypothetical protein SAMN04487995_2225 [Dyadobacter koreensis]